VLSRIPNVSPSSRRAIRVASAARVPRQMPVEPHLALD
jgi:hypothetical protein